MPLTVADFVHRWKINAQSERASAQSQFNEICDLLGQPHPAADAARSLVRLRDAWLNPPDIDPRDLPKRTLTNLYNQRPAWLSNAHQALDQAVFAAYGWPANLSKEEILARLLALNNHPTNLESPSPRYRWSPDRDPFVPLVSRPGSFCSAGLQTGILL